jgi:hypothetical protein
MAKQVAFSGAQHLQRGQLQHQFNASNKTISAVQLYLRFASLVHADPNTFNLQAKVGDWINPWPSFAPAFVNVANNFPPYKSDGIRISLRDISSAQTIGDVGEKIANRYVKNGWTIT